MSELAELRRTKDEFFGRDYHSPLSKEQRKAFKGLRYFEENTDLRLALAPEVFERHDTIEIQINTGGVTQFVKWGRLSFEVDGQPVQLTLFKDEEDGHFFLPFSDATSGHETYSAGRYLELEELPDGRILVDFNFAYNPYCAYNSGWSCPLTPFENRIDVPIRAGEMRFE